MLVIVETNDLGSAFLYFGIFLAMLYVATGARSSSPPASRCSQGAALAYTSIGRVGQRIDTWLDQGRPARRRLPARTGALLDRQRRLRRHRPRPRDVHEPRGDPYIPYLDTDFIFAALAQELGLSASPHSCSCFMVLCLRGFRAAILAEDGFSKLLAVGFTFGLALQAFIIVGGVLRVIPLTGITLPFVSYGVERRRELRDACRPAARLHRAEARAQ